MIKPVKLTLVLLGLSAAAWLDGDGRITRLDVAPRLLGLEVRLELTVERAPRGCDTVDPAAPVHRPDGQEVVCE